LLHVLPLCASAARSGGKLAERFAKARLAFCDDAGDCGCSLGTLLLGVGDLAWFVLVCLASVAVARGQI